MEKDTSMEEKIYFWTSDKIKLCGILTRPNVQTNKCIILCHGITVDKDEGGIFTDLACKLADVGFAVFRFDFRGHGESGGKSIDTTISGEAKDIDAAFTYLRGKGFTTFGMVSASFGGGPAAFYLAKNKDTVKALCLWNPLIDYISWIKPYTIWATEYLGKPAYERLKKIGFTEIGSRKFKIGIDLYNEIRSLKPWKELLKIAIPILFIHGDKDTDVPYSDSVKYSKIVKNGSLTTINGADHGFHNSAEDSARADKSTLEFFLRNL